MILNIACSTDDNYIQHCVAMLCSLFENNKEHKIVVHLLNSGLSEKSQSIINTLCKRYSEELRFYDVEFSSLSSIKIKHEALSLATFYRIYLPSLLDKKINRVLYLDCDVIVLKDISEIYKLNLDEYGVAAVKDVTPENNLHRQILGMELDDRAFCAGVLMINLKYWRERNCQKKMLKYINDMGDKLVMEDQDVLNYEFHQHWFELPYKYGKTPMAIVPLDKNQKWQDIYEFVFEPSIIHYATHVKPWLDIRIPDDKFYWKYVELSSYPNPCKVKVSNYNRKRIKKTKLRYYVNYYIHPFIPDLIEALLIDIVNIIYIFTFIFRINKFKEYRIHRWLHKYGL